MISLDLKVFDFKSCEDIFTPSDILWSLLVWLSHRKQLVNVCWCISKVILSKSGFLVELHATFSSSYGMALQDISQFHVFTAIDAELS